MTQTWAVLLGWILGVKSFVQEKSSSKPGERLHTPEAQTLLTSSKDKTVNSKKPLLREITPHFPKSFHMAINLLRIIKVRSNFSPFGHNILPCRLCLQASTPVWYSSSRILIDRWFPLMIGWGSWDIGISHPFTAWAKVFDTLPVGLDSYGI